ncbi:MAG: hypothetical protein U1G05_04955 [Kiritimatiellia bacterium]
MDTGLPAVLRISVTQLPARGTIVLVTDGFFELPALLRALLRHCHQEVWLLQVLAEEETTCSSSSTSSTTWSGRSRWSRSTSPPSAPSTSRTSTPSCARSWPRPAVSTSSITRCRPAARWPPPSHRSPAARLITNTTRSA